MNIPKFATFSIVARDETTGQIGVAGTTHWFAYGKNVPHIRENVGAVATQASTNLNYGTEGLNQLEKTNNAEEALKIIVNNDPDTNGIYQVILIDKHGNTAGHTGENTKYYSNHFTKKGVAVAGNFLTNEIILQEMMNYYHRSKEPFALKLIKTLQHGEKSGGDIRGKRSAALKIITNKTENNPWEDILYDLRIDDDKDPLGELERQYFVAKSFHFLNSAADTNSFEEQTKYFEKALEAYPNNSEALFWYALSCWENNKKTKAASLKKMLVKHYGKNWDELWHRLTKER